MWETLVIAVIGSVISMMAPGPNLVAVAATALGPGRKPALAVAAGVSAGTMVWVLFAAFGFGALLAVQPALLAMLKILGGAYLMFLAARILYTTFFRSSGPTDAPDRGMPSNSKGLRRNFLFGLLVVLTNPKALLLWASISTLLFGAGFSSFHVALFGPTAALLSMINYGAYALLFSSERAQRSVARSTRWLDTIASACFGYFGGRLFADGVAEIAK